VTSPQPLDTPIHRVLAALKSYKAAGSSKWKASCPAHDDRVESLSIRVMPDGKVLLNCHAKCKTTDVCAAMGLTMGDLFSEEAKRKPAATGPDPRNRQRMTHWWPYVDANGVKLFESVRFEWPLQPGELKPKKKHGQRRMVNNEWVWNLDGVPKPLYRLPDVIEAVAMGRTVCVVEGEKAADAMVEAGFCATTNPLGAGKWTEEHTATLKGATVAVFPDNDDPGEQHGQQVVKALFGVGCAVKLVRLKGLPPKGDVVDWFDAGGDMADLAEIIERTAPWGPRRVLWKLSDLWKSESIMRPPPTVVPRLAWVGRSTLLAAREKSGKSTLIGYIAGRVSRGEEFLGEYCVQGDVLIVGLEEFLGDVARRLKRFGAAGERVTLMNGFLGEQSRADELRGHVEDLTPALTVVDSLIAFANDRGIDENDAAMATVVQPLTDMAHATGTALVIVHHANKAQGKARGSTAIMGATDVVCEFFAPDEDADPTNRRVRSVGRVPLVRQFDMRFDGDTFALAEGPKAPLDTRIMAVVRDRPGISTNDVADTVGGSKSDVISTLHRMQAENVLDNKQDSFRRAKWTVAQHKLI
jgi:putative DNA primase/helicase